MIYEEYNISRISVSVLVLGTQCTSLPKFLCKLIRVYFNTWGCYVFIAKSEWRGGEQKKLEFCKVDMPTTSTSTSTYQSSTTFIFIFLYSIYLTTTTTTTVLVPTLTF